MLVKFRHGIIKQKKDSVGNPSSIYVDGNLFRISATKKDPFGFTIAHGEFDYQFNITDSNLVWKIEPGTWNLYVDVDFLTATISTGKTNLPVYYTGFEPQDGTEGQHWYNTTTNVMKVLVDGQWNDVLRLFVASANGADLIQARVGSQFISNTPRNPLFPTFDTFGYPMRVRRPKDAVGQIPGFLGSTTEDKSPSKTLVRMGDFLIGATTVTQVPPAGLVHLLPGNKVCFSDSTSPYNHVIGMVVNGAEPNQLVDIKTFGFVTYEPWEWTDAEISRPVFSDGAGNVVSRPPKTGNLQQVGFILSKDTIFLDIKWIRIATIPRVALPFVPGVLRPSVQIGYVKQLRFTGSEITYDFETEPVEIFTPATEISYSFDVTPARVFIPSTDILYSFGLDDSKLFQSGSEIVMIGFDDYGRRNFSGNMETFGFNTTIQEVLGAGRDVPLLAFSVFDLYRFSGAESLKILGFATAPTKLFSPAAEIMFKVTALDNTVFVGKFSGEFTFQTVAKKILSSGSVIQVTSFGLSTKPRVLSYGNTVQLVKF